MRLGLNVTEFAATGRNFKTVGRTLKFKMVCENANVFAKTFAFPDIPRMHLDDGYKASFGLAACSLLAVECEGERGQGQAASERATAEKCEERNGEMSSAGDSKRA
jgi:hypothetical protein